MDVLNVIKNRRSIRIFKNDVVEDDILNEGIKYGMLAPSAHNRQPWKFKIVSLEEKNHIADMLIDKFKEDTTSTALHTAGIIKNVPHLIIIYIDNDNKENRDMDIISIGACIQNMILYYESVGLGTLWIGNTNYISDEISEYLGINYETVSCLAVGYKDQDPKMRPRKDFNDVII